MVFSFRKNDVSGAGPSTMGQRQPAWRNAFQDAFGMSFIREPGKLQRLRGIPIANLILRASCRFANDGGGGEAHPD